MLVRGAARTMPMRQICIKATVESSVKFVFSFHSFPSRAIIFPLHGTEHTFTSSQQRREHTENDEEDDDSLCTTNQVGLYDCHIRHIGIKVPTANEFYIIERILLRKLSNVRSFVFFSLSLSLRLPFFSFSCSNRVGWWKVKCHSRMSSCDTDKKDKKKNVGKDKIEKLMKHIISHSIK